jgi:hypothetical protein
VRTTMYIKTILKMVLLLSFLFLVCGCLGVDGDFRKTRNEVFKLLNTDELDREFEYSFSGFEIFLASKIASLSDRTFDIEMLLEKISNVQIGIYNLGGNELLTSETLNPLEERMRKKGWTRLIKSCDHNDKCFVYVNIENTERIKDVFILVVDSEQLVMLEVHGKLDKLVEQVIKKRGIKV